MQDGQLEPVDEKCEKSIPVPVEEERKTPCLADQFDTAEELQFEIKRVAKELRGFYNAYLVKLVTKVLPKFESK